MNRVGTYFYAQWKRIWKMLPAQLIVNLVVCVCIGLLAGILLKQGVVEPGRQRFRIGLVGNTGDTYLGFGISAIQSVDDSRFIFDLAEMTEEEARKEFLQGKLYAYAIIPDDLIASITSGANDRPITFIATKGQKGLGSMIVEETGDILSEAVLYSQSAVYGVQNVLLDNGRDDIFWEMTEQINLLLIELVMQRGKLCDVEILGMANGLSTAGYYFCSVLLVLFLLSGINNSPLFVRRSRELPKILSARGVGAVRQVMGEYFAYLCLILLCFSGVFIVLGACLSAGIIDIAEWRGFGAEPLFGFIIGLLPVIAMLAAMQFMLYELVTGFVGSVLLQFICGVSMGYLSGFFYPAYFFPETLRTVGELIPTGVSLRYADGCMTDNVSAAAVLGVFLYLFAFLALSVAARNSKIKKGWEGI